MTQDEQRADHGRADAPVSIPVDVGATDANCFDLHQYFFRPGLGITCSLMRMSCGAQSIAAWFAMIVSYVIGSSRVRSGCAISSRRSTTWPLVGTTLSSRMTTRRNR